MADLDYKNISTLMDEKGNVKAGHWDEIVNDIKNRNFDETLEMDEVIDEYIYELSSELEIEHLWDNENLRALINSGYEEINIDRRAGDTFTRVIEDAFHDLYRDFIEANAQEAGVSV